MHLRLEKLEDDNRTLGVLLRSKRYQIMDRFHAVLKHVPGFRPTMRWLWNRRNKEKPPSSASSRRLEDSPAGLE
jgi:hypothetical protein